MKVTRNNVFETNSSSTHSLSVSKDGKLVESGKLLLSFGEFGWGYDVIDYPSGKLSYLLTLIQYKEEGVNEKNFTESKYYIWTKEMLEKYTGRSIDDINFIEDECFLMGYIDHQSRNPDFLETEGLWSNDEFTFKSNMEEFVFNSKYKVIIDNDNY